MQITTSQPEHEPIRPASDTYPLRWSDYLLLALVGIGLLGATLLGNPAHEASRAWPQGSFLRPIVWLLSLGFGLPTSHGIEIKSLVVTIISSLLLVGATLRLIRRRVGLLDDWQGFRGDTTQRVSAATLSAWAALLLVVWGWLSATWSPDAAISFGSVWVFSLGWVWAAGLALHGHRSIVRPLTDVLLGAAAITAILSLWYWKVRAAEARLGWPMGNPLLLASVMVPAVVLGTGRLADRIRAAGCSSWSSGQIAGLAARALGIGLSLATLLATGSRGAVVALAVGVAVAGWIALTRVARIFWGLLLIAVLVLAAPMAASRILHAGGGRDASARMRLYAWRDALTLAYQKPAAGQGAGGFARLGTSLSRQDAVADPLAMSGDVATHAHCEMLELLADLGVFGLFLGLAVWGFAGVASGAKARGEDRWIAAGITGAIVAVFVDACSGVSWRFPGAPAYMAMPVALAWMMWRRPRHADLRGRGFTWQGLIPAVVGLAVASAGSVDFLAARSLYRAQLAAQRADLLRQRWEQLPESQRPAAAQAVLDASTYAMQQADWAKRWRLDPPRRLEAWMASGRLREPAAYWPLLLGQTDMPHLSMSQQVLDDGLQILSALNRVAPDYADLQWRMAEMLDGKASLAQRAGQAEPAQLWRGQSLNAALQYFSTNPLDADRIWRALAIWPEIGPEQRLHLLRGVLREEAQVWKPAPSLGATAWQRWSEQHWYLDRPWYALGEQAQAIAGQALEIGHSQKQMPYSQWPDLLAPEGVRIAAWQAVVAGDLERAEQATALADSLYKSSDGLLPYSEAANYLDVAANRMRRNPADAAGAQAALADAQRLLRTLPPGWVREQIEQVAQTLQQAIQAIAGQYAGEDPVVWQAAVDLYWDMPPQTWPKAIDAWAQRADALLAQAKAAPVIALQLAIARGDRDSVQSQARQLLEQGTTSQQVDAAVRQAGYRWPWRQEIAAELLKQARAAVPAAGHGSGQ